MAKLIEMRFIKRHENHLPGDRTSVTRMHAGTLEAAGVAVRERPAHGGAKRKPITSRQTVTKEE